MSRPSSTPTSSPYAPPSTAWHDVATNECDHPRRPANDNKSEPERRGDVSGDLRLNQARPA